MLLICQILQLNSCKKIDFLKSLSFSFTFYVKLVLVRSLSRICRSLSRLVAGLVRRQIICFVFTYVAVLFSAGSPAKGPLVSARDSAKDTEKGKSNLPPDTSLWTVTEVVSFFSSLGFPEEAKSFQNQVSIDMKFLYTFLLTVPVIFFGRISDNKLFRVKLSQYVCPSH